MRRWIGLAMLLSAGAAHAAAWEGRGRPIASHFDLSDAIVAPAFDVAPRLFPPANRWALHHIETPPGPPRDPPRFRVRGQHVKFRIPL